MNLLPPSLVLLSTLTSLITIMATQISSLFDELDAICQRIVEIEWKDQDIARKRKASSRLRKLSDDLEETGDLCDRIIYQVDITYRSFIIQASH